MRFVSKVLGTAFLAASTLSAQAFVIGSAAVNTGNSFPFGFTGWSPEYQQVYAASQFSSALKITSLTFYNTQYDSGIYSLNGGNYQLYLSTTSKAVNGLDSTMSNNLGADNTLVFSGALPAGSVNAFGAHFDFNLSTLFNYDPTAGNLLLSVVSSDAASSGIFLDVDNSGSVMSRAFENGSRDRLALVTGFNEAAGTVPEPTSLALISLALVGLATSRLRSRC